MYDNNFIDDLKRDIEKFRQDYPDEVDLNDSLDRSLEDIKEGRTIPWNEVKRKRLVN
jgi:hypothetical protein